MTDLSNELASIMERLVAPNVLAIEAIEEKIKDMLEHNGNDLDFRIWNKRTAKKDGELCGDFIGVVHTQLTTIKRELERTKNLVVATSEAYENYPPNIINDEGNRIDVGEWQRNAFINGYMSKE